ncbi:MAG: type III-B CRISPR module RAMP protein Cmr4, partial [Desulfatibacillaceae bacterium]|nr:type III-B CRISPR module RAMP protein Cmr4 [Desulfatibacillaceae bacterium]
RDPIHVGSGEQRLGRVDNSIYRETGTMLPNIPAKSYVGVARTGTAIITNEGHCAGKSDDSADASTNDGKNTQCDKAKCPVCVPYGFTKDNSSLEGLAQFHDARLLLFPVYSLLGTIWVTSPWVLRDFVADQKTPSSPKMLHCQVPGALREKLASAFDDTPPMLNFGWLSLPLDDDNFDIKKCNIKGWGNLPESLRDELAERCVLVGDEVFSRIVNANLEVRTSVSIDPFTGAAAHGALYTYEAVPRGAVYGFSISYKNPLLFKIGGNKIDLTLEEVKHSVHEGLAMLNILGVGAMKTRGFGRFEVFC